MKLTKEQSAILRRLGWKKSKDKGVQMELDLSASIALLLDCDTFNDALHMTKEMLFGMGKSIYDARDRLYCFDEYAEYRMNNKPNELLQCQS